MVEGGARQGGMGGWEVPPWERPGAYRRDCATHRGGLLKLLGVLGLALSGVGLGAVVGLPLGLTTWLLARGDLAQMRAGLMDPGGQVDTEVVRNLGGSAVLLALIFGVFFSLLIVTEAFTRL